MANIVLLFFLTLFSFFKVKPAHSQSLDSQISEISKQIQDLENTLTNLHKESGNISSQLGFIQKQTTLLTNQVTSLETQLEKTDTQLVNGQFRYQERLRFYYKKTNTYNDLAIFFSNINQGLRTQAIFSKLLTRDQKALISYATQFEILQGHHLRLKNEKSRLANLKINLESKQKNLSSEIQQKQQARDTLSQKQKELLAQKEALFSTSVGEASTSDDPASRADYNPGFSPAFAAFSFGAPHRKGMSQYGAYARAKSGQNYETILKAYYGNIKIEKRETSGSIKTTAGDLPFEDNYLLGIAEMPARWGDSGGAEALKAQAIAARTYALVYTDNLKKSICTTESCQVYSKSRKDNPGAWKKAVEDTRGLVVVSNTTGNMFSTLYASTAGGSIYSYTSLGHNTPALWDTKCGAFSCWPQESWEKDIPSPWFYKGWYKSRSGVTAGRSHPWLSKEQFVDILNAVNYFSKTNDSSRLSQVESCLGACDSQAWSREELSRQVQDKGGAITSVSSLKSQYSTNGTVSRIEAQTNLGTLTFSGEDFKDIFNLRAPGVLHIKSLLFNIEQK